MELEALSDELPWEGHLSVLSLWNPPWRGRSDEVLEELVLSGCPNRHQRWLVIIGLEMVP